MPGLNFAFHCLPTRNSDYPTLLRCPKMEEAIRICQKNSKKVYISLGGGVGKYGFETLQEANLLAYRVYHLFLEGNDMPNLRPFGE